MSQTPVPTPVPPNSVRVWRGFRSETKSFEDFRTFLGTVFVPACSLLQPNAGLRAYLPAMPTQTGKPATVPDQTALMFWKDPQAHDEAFKTVAVRAYTNLHGDAYGKGSISNVPVLLGDAVAPDTPYYLIPRPADWMLGHVQHLVGANPHPDSGPAFLERVHDWAASLRDSPPEGLEGALLCANDHYVVAWLLWASSAAPTAALDGLASLVTTYLHQAAETSPLPAGLWDDWPGIDLEVPGALNIQLVRPHDEGRS